MVLEVSAIYTSLLQSNVNTWPVSIPLPPINVENSIEPVALFNLVKKIKCDMIIRRQKSGYYGRAVAHCSISFFKKKIKNPNFIFRVFSDFIDYNQTIRIWRFWKTTNNIQTNSSLTAWCRAMGRLLKKFITAIGINCVTLLWTN